MNGMTRLQFWGWMALGATSLVAHATGASSADEGWSWKVGADDRIRYELRGAFRNDKDDKKNVVYNRLRVNAAFDYKDSFTLFIEGLDAREWTHDAPHRGQEDDFDLHQAYVSLERLFGSGVRAKLGRQKISYGRKRILAAPTWGNKIRSFDAATVGWRGGQWDSDVFFGCPITYESGFNTPNDDEQLTGLYNTWHVNARTSLDVYAVRKEKPLPALEGVAQEQDRYTTGLRLAAKTAAGTAVDAEAAYQFGDEGDAEVNAYALACRVDQCFEAMGRPRLGLEVNLASGDSDPNDNTSRTFIPPYQTTHAPYGIIDFFRWQNLREIAVFGSIEVTPNLAIKPEAHAYWLDEGADAWYGTSGKALNAPGATEGVTYAGVELSAVTKYRLGKHTALEGGYSLFLPGDAADDISDEDAVHYGYVQVALKR